MKKRIRKKKAKQAEERAWDRFFKSAAYCRIVAEGMREIANGQVEEGGFDGR